MGKKKKKQRKMGKKRSAALERLEKSLKVLFAFEDPGNWNPIFTKISKETGVAVSSIYDKWHKHKGRFEIKVRLLSDLEYLEKLKRERENKS